MLFVLPKQFLHQTYAQQSRQKGNDKAGQKAVPRDCESGVGSCYKFRQSTCQNYGQGQQKGKFHGIIFVHFQQFQSGYCGATSGKSGQGGNALNSPANKNNPSGFCPQRFAFWRLQKACQPQQDCRQRKTYRQQIGLKRRFKDKKAHHKGNGKCAQGGKYNSVQTAIFHRFCKQFFHLWQKADHHRQSRCHVQSHVKKQGGLDAKNSFCQFQMTGGRYGQKLAQSLHKTEKNTFNNCQNNSFCGLQLPPNVVEYTL